MSEPVNGVSEPVNRVSEPVNGVSEQSECSEDKRTTEWLVIMRFSVTRNVPLETAQQRHDYAHVIAQTKEDNLKAKFRHRLERLYASHYLCMTNLFFGVCSRVD